MKSINQCISVIQTSYDIVKAHGGELKVEILSAETTAPAGKDNEGTIFILSLPLGQGR